MATVGPGVRKQARLRSINKLWDLLDEYEKDVNASPLTDSSKKDYFEFARLFVRWADNDFEPGRQLRNGNH